MKMISQIKASSKNISSTWQNEVTLIGRKTKM